MTLAWKCRGLSDEQLRVTLPPSSMTLAGLLKHLACVGDSWFTEVVAGEPAVDHGQALLPHPVSLRWVLVHMIGEYARHNGHADLIRESIDGQTGD
jgi:hypothetical protein